MSFIFMITLFVQVLNISATKIVAIKQIKQSKKVEKLENQQYSNSNAAKTLSKN